MSAEFRLSPTVDVAMRCDPSPSWDPIVEACHSLGTMENLLLL